jgi:tRNA G10  N-methylase Trm11
MQYAFVLGRVYTLSIAELIAVFAELGLDIKIVEISLEVMVIETPQTLDVEKFQRRLGGTIKILKIIDVIKKREQDSINFALQNYFKPSKMKSDFLKDYKGKIQFGVSVYLLDPELPAFGEPRRIGMFIKRAMQDTGASIRLVLPEFNSLTLASVVVTKNLLLSKGAEICVLASVDRVYTAKTIAVQDFEDYGRRDYQRPVRDEKQGMIPPKVAQVMLNLSGAKLNDTLLDPFCGIGTIVQEGALLGYRVLGTDINPQAIAGSEKNLEWFRNRYKVPKGKYHLETVDAREVARVVENLISIKAFPRIAGIVSEGTLGPMYGKYPKPNEIEANFKDLESLYISAFKEFAKILSKDSKIVLCLPAYKKNQREYEQFPYLDSITSLGYNLVDLIPSNLSKSMPFLRLTERSTAIYDRKDQIVAREIVIFQKLN